MQLRRTEIKVIGESTYEITQLGAIKGRSVLVRVLKLLGPAFTSGDMARLFEGLHEEDITYLCDQFGPLTMVDGKPLMDIFDLQFAGRYKDMMQWLLACLQLNFGDFLKGSKVSGMVKALADDPASQSTSPKASIG